MESYYHLKKNTLSVKKKPVKSDKFFSGDQYFSRTNNFTRLKLTPTKYFYQLFFLLNKSQITEILKNYQIHYTIIWLSGVGQGRVVKKGKFTAADQSKLVSYTNSSSEEEKDLYVDVSFDEPLTWPLINFSVFKIVFQRNK